MSAFQSRFCELAALTYLHLKERQKKEGKLLVTPEMYAFFKEEAKLDFAKRQKLGKAKEETSFANQAPPPPKIEKAPVRKILKPPAEKPKQQETKPTLEPAKLALSNLEDVELLFKKLFPNYPILKTPEYTPQKGKNGKALRIVKGNESPQMHRFLQGIVFAMEKLGFRLCKEGEDGNLTIVTPLGKNGATKEGIALLPVEAYAKDPMKKKELWQTLLKSAL